MDLTLTKFVLGLAILMLSLVFTDAARAQAADASLSGTITDPSGAFAANAKISVKNAATGQSAESTTDSAGHYEVLHLMPGEYEISVSATGFSTSTDKVTIPPGAMQTFNLTFANV
jgi:hypothetical protein